LTLISLGFADCESCKALIFKGSWCAGKTPKAGVAGSIPAGRAKTCLFRLSAVSPHHSHHPFPACSNIPAGYQRGGFRSRAHPTRRNLAPVRFDALEARLKRRLNLSTETRNSRTEAGAAITA